MAGLISVSVVDERIAGAVTPAGTVRCPLRKAVGRVLREPLVADRDLPPFDRVMMDGYAIRFEDINGKSFSVSNSQMAGDAVSQLPATAGSAIEVMTGAVLPLGANTVVPYEDTAPKDKGFTIQSDADVDAGQFVHRKGSDYREGTTLLQPGCRIGAVEAGIAASNGCSDVVVSQLPRISIFGTGDECVPVEDSPAPHQIRRSNALSIEATLLAAGFACGTTGHLGDDEEKYAESLHASVAESDVVIISGAVSKGKRDWIPAVLNGLGECLFHGVAQRPGKPMGVWKAESGCIVFALPGNPVSTLVGVHRHVLPWLCQRQAAFTGPQPLVSLSEPFSFDRPLTLFLPVKLDNRCHAHPCPVNNSGDYAGLAGTDGFVELPAAQDRWEVGATVKFYPWMK